MAIMLKAIGYKLKAKGYKLKAKSYRQFEIYAYSL